jgi:hypothetical protein
MDVTVGTWNVRSLYRVGSLKTEAIELVKYNCDLVGAQEVRRDNGGSHFRSRFFVQQELDQ